MSRSRSAPFSPTVGVAFSTFALKKLPGDQLVETRWRGVILFVARGQGTKTKYLRLVGAEKPSLCRAVVTQRGFWGLPVCPRHGGHVANECIGRFTSSVPRPVTNASLGQIATGMLAFILLSRLPIPRQFPFFLLE
jgi:hypothetical protein